MSEKHVVCPLGICLQQQLQDLLDNKDIQIARLRNELAARNAAISAARLDELWLRNTSYIGHEGLRAISKADFAFGLREAGATVEEGK